jgi:hypothetical protein
MVRRLFRMRFYRMHASQDIAPSWSIERIQEKGNHVAQRRHRKLRICCLRRCEREKNRVVAVVFPNANHYNEQGHIIYVLLVTN